MNRFATTLSAGAAVAVLVAMPATAQAQDRSRVDDKTGPVAFANAAALAVVDDGRDRKGGSVISETQRSPVVPGTSRLSDERSTVPQGDDERNAVGPNYLVDLGDHDVTATLRDSHVPTATATADYQLSYGPDDTTVLEFDAATSTVECAAPDELRTDTTAGELRVLDENGQLSPVPLPDGDKTVTRTDLPFGAPVEIEGADVEVRSDISVRRVTALDELLRQDQWRGGDATAAAGWLVEIVSHVSPAVETPEEPEDVGEEATGATGTQRSAGEASAAEESSTEQAPSPESSDIADAMPASPDTEPDAAPSSGTVPPAGTEGRTRITAAGEPLDITTRIVLGGVSCSLPNGFVPVGSDGTGDGPAVPVKIPAGTPAADGNAAEAVWGWSLLGGGVLLGAGALLLTRRRTPAAVTPEATSANQD